MDKQPKKNPLNNYVRYSNLAFQMVAIILIGVFGGVKLDEWLGWEIPVFTVLLSLVSVVVAILFAVKDFIKKK